MRAFTYERPASLEDAVALAGTDGRTRLSAPTEGAVLYAAGTTMFDLMKLGVTQPERVIDLTRLADPRLRRITVVDDVLRFGSLVTMHEAAEHSEVRERAPAMSESLWLAASQQLRHMATLGGNVMQRTRCPFYRDPSWNRCNKRNPGSGCQAIEEPSRLHAVLGTSDACIAMYPGDWAQALVAFDAVVEVIGPDGEREIAFDGFHRLPASAPELETVLAPGEIITGYRVSLTPALARSTYIKARDRESYAFANASAAVGLQLSADGRTVEDVRIGLGGVASVPWRARAAEDILRGEVLDTALARRAGEAAFAGARIHDHTAFKVPLGVNVVVKALATLMSEER